MSDEEMVVIGTMPAPVVADAPPEVATVGQAMDRLEGAIRELGGDIVDLAGAVLGAGDLPDAPEPQLGIVAQLNRLGIMVRAVRVLTQRILPVLS